MWRSVLLTALSVSLVTCQLDDTRPVKCMIRVQACTNVSDSLNVGFIDVGTKRLESWNCVDSETERRIKVAYVTGSCQYERLLPEIDSNSDGITSVFDEIIDSHQRVPYGGYFILVSAYAGYSYFIAADGRDDAERKYSSMLADLHIVVDRGLYLLSEDETYEGDDDAGFILISRKGYPDEGTFKVVDPSEAPRVVHFPVRATQKEFCVQPLTPLDSIFLDPRIYGHDDTYSQITNMQLEDMMVFPAGLHLMSSEKIGCNRPVYGWEFIPANAMKVYFAIVRPDSGDDVDLDEGLDNFLPEIIGTTVVDIVDEMITDDLEVHYKCLRPHPIIDVQVGDLFMFYTDNKAVPPASKPPLKRMYIPPATNEKFPCSRQLTSFEAGKVDIFSADSGDLGSTYSHSIKTDMNVALKPIVDHDFMYRCPCTEDSDCQMHGDPHMICGYMDCICNRGYTYNRATNLCVYAELAENSMAHQSSVLGDLDENRAGMAVDGDTKTDVLTGTCAKTEADSDPWWLLDLGEEMLVYGVDMRTPEPLDVYLELWEDETQTDLNPDAVLYKHEYKDITADPGLTTVEAIVVHGPKPWIIKTSDSSDVKILNTALTDGETLYKFNDVNPSLNFGSVGVNIGQIIKIEDFGMLQKADDSLCMYYKDPNIRAVALDEGEKCAEQVPGDGEMLIVYVEESSVGTEDFYIRNIKSHLAMALNSFTAGTKTVLGSDKTTFRFFLNNGDRGSSSSASVDSVLDDGSGVLIVPTNDENICLEVQGGYIVVGSSCTTFFYLKKYFDDTLPEYTYSLEPWDGSVDDVAPYLEVDLLNSTVRPCYEIVRTTHEGSEDVGAAVTYVSETSNDVWVAVRDGDLDITTDDTEVLMRANVVGVHDFVVGVSNLFDGTNFYPENFTTCASFGGAPVNGRLFRLDCETPVYGRYVALYMETPLNEKIQLCDFNVLTLSGAHSPIGDICYEDEDCDYQGDDGKICDYDLHEDYKRGLCACREGLTYHRDSSLCIDVDECLEYPSICEQAIRSKSGEEDGFCVNTVGSFHCECDDGFEPVPVPSGYICLDIDETQIDNCGCEGLCLNQAVDEGGLKYVCSCPVGYELALDDHGCMDINECLDGLCSSLYVSSADTMAPNGCENHPGTYKCLCPHGFEYTLNQCTNIDECVHTGPSGPPNQAGCESECVDKNPALDGGLLFQCSCNDTEGYTLSDNLLTCVDFDECEETPCEYVFNPQDVSDLGTSSLESGMCINTAGSFHCECPFGYRWLHGRNLCADNNECVEDHECEFSCVNMPGDYMCFCDTGYQLSLNNHSCEDVDECIHPDFHDCDYALKTNLEAAECINTIGSYKCHCPPGYEWTCSDDDGCLFHGCFDIDECARGTSLCQYACHNRYVRLAGVPFFCTCDEGWMLAADNRTCVDLDECAGMNICEGDGLAECINSIGSFICSCSRGYEFDMSEEKCADVDECADNNGGCSKECENTVGSFHCRCPHGYNIDPNGRACIDVNECADVPCLHTCYNNPGSFYCTCHTGYLPDPHDELNCVDIDECSRKNGGCMHDCTNNDGSFECGCWEGYSLMADRESCDVHDECFNPLDNDCAEVCINTFAGFECDCYKGRRLNPDGKTCDDLNECQTFNGGCEEECVNTDGSYYCECPDGYSVGLNPKQCHDIDECSTNNGYCDDVCINTKGYYICLCDGGLKIGQDGHKCVGQNFIRVRMIAKKTWDPSYGDIDTPEFKALQASLEYNFKAICAGAVVGNSYGSVECRVVGPFTQGSVIFDLIVLTPSPLSEGDRSVLSYAIKQSLEEKGNYLVINGSSVPIEGKLQFIYMTPGGSGGNELIWSVDSLCTYYDETGFCLYGGSCEVERGYPICKCLEGYEGDRCNKVTSDDLTTTEIALIASVSVVGLLVIFLGIMSCWLCMKQEGRGPGLPEEDEQLGEDKSTYGARFPYFNGSNYWQYGNYN